jgi:hypothetical protein
MSIVRCYVQLVGRLTDEVARSNLCTRHRHAHHYVLSYVLVAAPSIVLYGLVSSCIVVYRARGGAVGRGVLFYYELTPSTIRRDGDDAIVIFRVSGVWTVQGWSHNMTDTKIQEFSMDSQI